MTAQRRTANLQDVSVAISAYGEDDLHKSSIGRIEDLAMRVPSLTYTANNPGDQQLFIRGIGSSIEGATADRSVGIFVDDVYRTRSQGASGEFPDLERIEVLRGPQGTLYGKNVVGGAINFVSRKPSKESRAGLEVTAGNYAKVDVKGFVSGPVSDGISGKLAVATQQHDGYAHNTYTGNDMETDSSQAVQGMLRFNGSESTDILLSADYFRQRGTGGWRDGIPVAPAFYIPDPTPFVSPDRRSGPNNLDGRTTVDAGGLSLSIHHQFSAMTLTSITAYRISNFDSLENTTGGYFTFDAPSTNIEFVQEYAERDKSLSQEFRIASREGEGRLSWLAGVYLLDQRTRDDHTNPITNFKFLFGGYPVDVAADDFTVERAKTRSYAAYARMGYDITDQWNLAGGLRWSRDAKDYSLVRGTHSQPYQSFVPAGSTGFIVNGSKSWSAVTPEVTLTYKPFHDHLLYATLSKGYKSGGWQGEGTFDPASVVPFNPEHVTNYELGSKNTWFNRRMLLNVAAFYMDFKDLQTVQIIQTDPMLPPVPQVRNAGKVVSKGAEVELAIVPMDGLTLAVSHSYLDAKIASSLIINGVDQDGNQARRSPRAKGTVSAEYAWGIGDHGTASARVLYQYTSSFYFDNDNNPVTFNPSTKAIDARLAFAPRDARWEVALWGHNLSDELITVANTDVFGVSYRLYAPPRTFGVTFTWKH